MKSRNNFSRRRFVQLAALGTGSICLIPGCTGESSSWRFFTDAEAKAVEAVSEQIIPADEWPGGRESGVTNFIDKQLKGPYKRYQAKYRKGIAAMQENCKSLYQKNFEDLPFDEQTSFLEKMEAGNAGKDFWVKGSDAEFFSLLRDHSMQAFYGSQIHGGNKDKMSYKMMRIDYPLIVGQNRYKS